MEIDRTDPEGPRRTLAAMESGAPVIYQAHLVAGGWGGYPDFLFRCPATTAACGGWHYTPWDTKLARSAKPGFLSSSAPMPTCWRPSGASARPSSCSCSATARSGRTRPTTSSTTTAGSGVLRRLPGGAGTRSRPPEPGLDRSWGRWEKTAEPLLERSDHLSRVANITRGQVRRLEEAGIATLTALAGAEPGTAGPHGSPSRCSIGSAPRPGSSSTRAATLSRSGSTAPRVPEEPRRGLALLPPPSDGDVFFDMEGFPYADGRAGVPVRRRARVDEVTPGYHDWWAHDEREERARLRGVHRLAHGAAAAVTRPPRLPLRLVRGDRAQAADGRSTPPARRRWTSCSGPACFVDLYRVVRQGFVIGTPSYSLKEIEHLYMPQRTGPVLSAGGSVVEYQRWIDSGQPRSWQESPILKGIREYNRVDCESPWALRSWLRERQRESGIDYLPRSAAGNGSRQSREPERAAAEALASRLVDRGRARSRRRTEGAARSTSSSAGWSSSTAARRSRCGGGCSSATR